MPNVKEINPQKGIVVFSFLKWCKEEKCEENLEIFTNKYLVTTEPVFFKFDIRTCI